MSKLLFSLFLVGLSFSLKAGNPGLSVKVKTSESTIEWTARKVTGQHNGSVAISEGKLHFNDGLLTGGAFTIDMPSITVLDLSGNGKTKLEGHLKSDDFFSVDKFPTASLVITKTTLRADGNYDVTADLTIKDITHPVDFVATVKPVNGEYHATADIKVDRTLYDVKYRSGKFFQDLGDSLIYDDFNLAVSLVAGE